MALIPQRCLVVGPAWVGDMVMAQSLFKALKERFPDMLIDVLAPAWSKPLLAAMPEVRAAIELPVQHGQLALLTRYRIARELRANAYDWAIVLPRSLKAALVPYWAKIPVRTGYKGEMRYKFLTDIRSLNKSVLTMTVQRFVALGISRNTPLPPAITPPHLQVTDEQRQQVAAKFLPTGHQALLALCPGAEYGEAKRWPALHYAEVAKYWIAKGGQVILLGSSKDLAVTAPIAAMLNSPACRDLAGKTNLLEVMVLLSLAEQVVSNDSGLMHVAAAVDTPVIAVYGSSDPNYTPPLSTSSEIIYLDLECSPCFKRECPLGHLNCLNKISPEQVMIRLPR